MKWKCSKIARYFYIHESFNCAFPRSRTLC